MYRLKLIKALSYKGVVEATRKKPNVFVEDKNVADAAVATGYFKLLESENIPVQNNRTVIGCIDKTQLEDMKIDDLKRLAEEIGIDTTGFKKKADYVEAIASEEISYDSGNNEIDYDQASPTMTELQD